MFIASSLKEFQNIFISRLHEMLSPDELGAFILVLANSMQDERLKRELATKLKNIFGKLRQGLEKQSLHATHDDLSVFEKITDTGISSLPAWQIEQHGPWLLLNNPMRALRPPRASLESVDSVHHLFDESRFNFNKPFLDPEILWRGELKGIDIKVLYNKFPFIPYHTIIVPEPEKNTPQLLTYQLHEFLWEIIEEQQTTLPGFAAGYNSMGACASVNHLHAQGFIQEQHLPIESNRWQHNGGNEAYPMYCQVYTSMQQCFESIDTLNRADQAYNILYRPGRCYLIPRQRQGSKCVNKRVQGAGWIEECGMFSVSDLSDMQEFTAEMLRDDLRSLSIK